MSGNGVGIGKAFMMKGTKIIHVGRLPAMLEFVEMAIIIRVQSTVWFFAAIGMRPPFDSRESAFALPDRENERLTTIIYQKTPS